MRPVDRDFHLRAPMPVAARDSKLACRGGDDRHRFAAPGSGLPDTAPPRRSDGSRRPSRPRPGWYAYRVTGSPELPSWAVEVGLTIERPASATGTVAGLWEPFAPEPGSSPQQGTGQALLLLRAPGRMWWLEAVADVIAEVEALAGVRPAAPEAELVEGGGGGGPRFRTGAALPGLTPVTATVALAHLRMAGSRGLPVPLRRRQPGTGGAEWAWRAGAGCVLTCDGPDGRSAQAVVALRGMGGTAAITAPPGGALVLRAWRAGPGWGMACGLVLGAAMTAGLGRAAGRVAAAARTAGWDASVVSGSVAMQLARAGSPGLPVPQGPGEAASRMQVTERFAACLAAGVLEGRAVGLASPPAVTP